jgi:hypothetical protein
MNVVDPWGMADGEEEGFNLVGFFVKPIVEMLIWGGETIQGARRTSEDVDRAINKGSYSSVEEFIERNPDVSSASAAQLPGLVRVAEDVKETSEAAGKSFLHGVDAADRVLLGKALSTAATKTTVGLLTRTKTRNDVIEVAVLRRHLTGNRQLSINGNRWNLPKGASISGIPAHDPLGNEIQGLALKYADKFSDAYLSPNELANINKELFKAEPRYYLIQQWKAQAKGRFVDSRVKAELAKRHPHLELRAKGVDIVNPETGIGYEVLSGTTSNIQEHATRKGMTDALFRYIEY